MTLNKKFTWGGVSIYEAPLVKTYEISCEGVLCGSFDSANFGYEDNDLGEI